MLDVSYHQSAAEAVADITERRSWANEQLLDYLIPYAELCYCGKGWEPEPCLGHVWWPEYGKHFPHVQKVGFDLVMKNLCQVGFV